MSSGCKNKSKFAKKWFKEALAIFIIIMCFLSFGMYVLFAHDIDATTRPSVDMLMDTLISWVSFVMGHFFGGAEARFTKEPNLIKTDKNDKGLNN
jgi:hypothetical protein